MDISQYLTSIFEGNDSNITTVHVCAAHTLHCVSWKCTKRTKNKDLKEILVRLLVFSLLMANRILCGINDPIIRILRLLCHILLLSKDLKNTTKMLLNMVRMESLEDKEPNESEQGVHKEDNFGTTIRVKLLFIHSSNEYQNTRCNIKIGKCCQW